MYKFLLTLISFISLLLLLFIFDPYRHVDLVKDRAIDRLKEFNYEECVYEGYSFSFIHGGKVWYQCKKDKRLYSLVLCHWNNELHLYLPYDKPIDGINVNVTN